MNLNQVTVEVSDIERAVAFYQTLGLTQIVASYHYARFVCGNEQGSTFSVHLSDDPSPFRGGVYFECDDLDARVDLLMSKGLGFDTQPVDQRWLWREAWLRDPDGNRICLYRAGENRVHPPWRIRPSDLGDR